MLRRSFVLFVQLLRDYTKKMVSGMSFEEDLQRRVDRGVVFLDETFGTTWPWMVNIGYLRMWSPSNCVLGQLHTFGGGFYEAVHYHLNGDFEEAGRLGFTCFNSEAVVTDVFHRLDVAWMNVIRARREADRDREVAPSAP